MKEPSNDAVYEEPKKKGLNFCPSQRDLVFGLLKKEYACQERLLAVNWAKISN